MGSLFAFLPLSLVPSPGPSSIINCLSSLVPRPSPLVPRPSSLAPRPSFLVLAPRLSSILPRPSSLVTLFDLRLNSAWHTLLGNFRLYTQRLYKAPLSTSLLPSSLPLPPFLFSVRYSSTLCYTLTLPLQLL
jgi:hypothetical protein